MKRFLSILLTLFMLPSCLLLSCKEPAETESETAGGTGTVVDGTESETGGEAESPTETEETLQAEEGFAKGKKLVMTGYTTYVDYTRDWVVDTPTGEPIENAVYQRNQAIQKHSGGTLEIPILYYTWSIMDQYNSNFIHSVKANNAAWDVLGINGLQGAFLTMNGILRNLYKVETLDLTHHWYNQELADTVAYNGQLFSVVPYGAITTMKAMVRIFVNDDMLERLKLQSIYDLVEANEWTFDKMQEYQIAGSVDAGGDGVWVDNVDTVGFKVCHRKFLPAFFYSAGMAFTYVDAVTGEPKISNLTANKVLDLHALLYEMCAYYGGIGSGKAGTVLIDDYANYTVWLNEKALMYLCDGRNISGMRDAAFNWGAVPLPKWDDKQDYRTMNDEELAVFAIPRDADPALSGKLLDTFSYYGYELTYDIYVEDVLYTKASATEQAARMYEILMNTQVYDFAFYYNIALYGPEDYGANSVFWRFRNHIYNLDPSDWVTYWGRYKDLFETGLVETLAVLSRLPD